MSAADGDAGLETHEFCQHLGAPYDGQESRPRFDQFGIALLDSRRNDDDLRLSEVGGLVADLHLDAELAQPRRIVVVGKIRSLHPVAEC